MRRAQFNLVASLLIVAQLLALAAVVLGALQRFLPQFRPGALLLACGLVAIEATYVQHSMRRERMWLAEGARYLVVEIVALVLLMRVVALLELNWFELRDWASELLRYPLSFFDYRYLGYLVAGLLIGVLGHACAADLDDLAPREFEQALDEGDNNQRLLALVGGDRLAALGRLSGRFVSGGIAVLLALTAQSLNVVDVGGPSLPLPLSAALEATCYFACGFLLYSQARLALLQSRWRLEGVAVAGGIGRRWTRSSLLLIGGVLALAALLPRAYGLGLFDAVALLVQGLSYVLILTGYVLITLVSLLALIPVLLVSWLTGGTSQPLVPKITPPPPPPVELVERTPPLLPALVFWACMIFLASYALWLFAQRHPGLLRALAANKLLRGLLGWLGATLEDAAGWSALVAQKLRTQLTPRARRKGPTRVLGLRRMAPRAALRFLYRALLEQARQQGLPRARGETPYEYSRGLAQRLPEAGPEIAALTEAFVAAEYSRHEPDNAAVAAAQRLWLRLRRLLRRPNAAG